KTKAFLISLFVFPILVGGAGFMQWMLKDQVDTSEKRFAIVDRTPKEKLAATLIAAGEIWNKAAVDSSGRRTKPTFILERIAPSADNPEAIAQQRFDLSERVRQEKIFGFLEIGPHVVDTSRAQPTASLATTTTNADAESKTSVAAPAAL